MAASCVALVSLVALCILTIEIAGGIIDLRNGTKAQIKQKASSLKCEACGPGRGEPCGENNVTSVECEPFADRCMTISVGWTIGSNITMIKFCANSTLNCQEKSQYNPCKHAASEGFYCNLECCEGDLCNQASPGKVNTTAVKPEVAEIVGGIIDLIGTKAQMKQKATSLKCESCGNDGRLCDGSNVTSMECEGFEDRCITITTSIASKTLVVKRCAHSTSNCQESQYNPCKKLHSIFIPCNFECCEGDLCNQASHGEVPITASNPSKPQEVAAAGIKCPVCTNLTGYAGAKNCDEAEIVTCEPAGVMDRCMSIDAVMSFSGVAAIPFQLKNCSNSFICDPDSDYNMCKMLNMTGYVTSCSLTCTTTSTYAHAWNLGAFLGARGLPNPKYNDN